MEFNTVKLITSAVFAVGAGMISSALTKGIMQRSTLLMIIGSAIASVAGAWNEWFAFLPCTLMMFALLCSFKASAAEAAAVSLLSATASFVTLVFASAIIAPCLEAYSYTLSNAFYYDVVNSWVVIAALAAAIGFLPLMVWLCRQRDGLGSSMAMCVIALSLSLAATMVLHMCFGQLVDYNAKYFKLPMMYSVLTGAIAFVSMLLTCIVLKALRRSLKIPGRLSETKEFYMILAAIISTVIFYCYENTILNNYTSFDEPHYKYTVSILIVLMIVTVLATLIAVCSYILRTREEQSRIEKEIEITEVYRNEIRDMQREIFDFKHDYSKIYSSMSTLIMNKRFDELESFFAHNITPIQKELFAMDEGAKAIMLLEDSAVQGLVYSYIIKAKKLGVTLLIDIREPVPEAAVAVLDLNRILGIFLDNAIEQAAMSDKEVGFGAIRRGDSVVYVINNSCEQLDVEKMFKRGESSKGKGRGRGLAIARKLCASHDEIEMHNYTRNGKFICEIYVDLLKG